jgi:superfamily II DNA or RNA helicase
LKLRYYQNKIIKETELKLKTQDKIIIALGMGGGKSLIITELTKRYIEEGKSVVILVNITELIPQLEEYFKDNNILYNLIKSNEEINNKDSKVNLIMEQSFHEKKRQHKKIKCDILIKDEFHIGYGGKRYTEIMEDLKPNKIIGLSGTPYDENGFLLNSFEKKDLITYGSTYELTKKKYLTPLKYYIPEWTVKIDYTNIKSTNDYITNELDKKINTNNHNKLIVESMNKMNAKNKKTLVYCNSIEHVNNIVKKLKEEGYNVKGIHSKKTKEENKETIEKFDLDNDGIDCLVSVSKLTTGFNKPQAELLVLCRPTKILRLYLQIIFRVARLNPGKKNGEILDLAQCVSYHGFGTKQPLYISSTNNKEKKREIRIKNKVENILNLEALKELTKTKKETTEIKEKDILVKIKEIRIKNVNITQTRTNELITIFENSWDIELIIGIKYELLKRIKDIQYTKEEVIYKIEETKEEMNKIEDKEVFLKQIKDKNRKQIKEQNLVK